MKIYHQHVTALLTLILIMTSGCQRSTQVPSAQQINNEIKSMDIQDLDASAYKTIGEGRVYITEYSPDGKILAVGTSLGVIFYDTTDYHQISKINVMSVEKVGWSPNGDFLAVYGGGGLFIYNYGNQNVSSLEDGDEVFATEQISWSPDGKYLAATSLRMYYADVWVWDATSGEKVHELSLHKVFSASKYAVGIAWSLDGRKLAGSFSVTGASGEDEAELAIWDLSMEKAKLLENWSLPNYVFENNEISSQSAGKVYWEPDNGSILVVSYGRISVLNAENGEIEGQYPFDGPIHDLKISDREIAVISGAKTLTLQTFSFPQFEKIKQIEYSTNPFCEASQMKYSGCNFDHAASAPDSLSFIASSSYKDGMHIFNATRDAIDRSIFLNSQWNNDLAFSPNSEYIAALGQDGYVRAYDVESLSLIDTIEYDNRLIWAEDGKLVTRTSQDGQDDFLLLNGKYSDNADSISPNGEFRSHIEKESNTNYTLTIRSISLDELIYSVEMQRPSMEIKWSPDGKWLITAASTIDDETHFGLLMIPTVKDGKPYLIANTGKLKGIDWSDNGEFIGATGYNGVIRLFIVDAIFSAFESME